MGRGRGPIAESHDIILLAEARRSAGDKKRALVWRGSAVSVQRARRRDRAVLVKSLKKTPRNSARKSMSSDSSAARGARGIETGPDQRAGSEG